MYREKSSVSQLKVPATTLSGMDMEEMRDYIARREMEFAMMEQSVSDFAIQCDERISAIIKERDAALTRTSQLEILLKGRQSALISKEEEIQRLKSSMIDDSSRRIPSRLSLCRQIASVAIGSRPTLEKFLSITSTVPHISLFPTNDETRTSSSHKPVTNPHLCMVYSDAVRIEPHVSLEIVPATSSVMFNQSPPRTVYHHKGYSNRFKQQQQTTPQRSLFMSTESYSRKNIIPSDDDDDSSDGFSNSFRPISRLRMSNASMQSARSFTDSTKYRESFSSIRSGGVSFVHSSDDDSDASLDDLLTSTMRLSRISTISSRHKSPQTLKSLPPSAFPKKWFK